MAAAGWGSAVFLEAARILVNPAAGVGSRKSQCISGQLSLSWPVFPASPHREQLLQHQALPGTSSASPSCAPVAPLGCGNILPQSSVVGVCSEQMSAWCRQSAAKPSPSQGAQGSMGTSSVLGAGVRADVSELCVQMGSGMLEELGNTTSL